jgi:hypothetical protein
MKGVSPLMENMKKNRKFALILSTAVLLTAGTAAIAANTMAKTPSVEAAGVTYSITFDKDHLIDPAGGFFTTSGSYHIWVNSSGYVAGTTNFGSFTSGGKFANAGDAPLYGIKSVTANIASGSMLAYFGYSGEATNIAINPANFVANTDSTVAIEGDPNFFNFAFTSDTVVNSISLTYTCNYIVDPTLETNDALDMSSEAEKFQPFAKATSWVISTSKVSTDSTRSHHAYFPSTFTESADDWPSFLLQLKTPIAIDATGHFSLDVFSGENTHGWMSIKTYDASWNQFGGECDESGDMTIGSWSTVTFSGFTAGTVAFVRIAFFANASKTVDFYLDNLRWVAA